MEQVGQRAKNGSGARMEQVGQRFARCPTCNP
jgi:hypothetical protein